MCDSVTYTGNIDSNRLIYIAVFDKMCLGMKELIKTRSFLHKTATLSHLVLQQYKSRCNFSDKNVCGKHSAEWRSKLLNMG